MSNVKQSPQHKANLGRNGFDMSQRNLFTSSVGQLIPCYTDELNPGDHIKISGSLLTRTQPLTKSAMTRLTEHIDYFFVPMQQLYSLWGSFFYGVNDVGTSLFSDISSDNYSGSIPLIGLRALRSALGGPGPLGDVDEFGTKKYYNVQRLLDSLGYGYNTLDFFVGSNNPEDETIRVNPLRLCAYQKIYYDYYRKGNRESNDPRAYNIDTFAQAGVDILDTTVLEKMTRLHYRPWKHDYFTMVEPSPLFSEQSNSSMPNSFLTTPQMWLDYDPMESVNANGNSSTNDDKTTIRNLGNVSAANIRAMFATEKLLEITRRAGKHYDKQTAAHFGYDVPQGVSGEVYYLGSNSNIIVISDVVAQAGTDSTPLGEVGGKGYGFKGDSRDIDFTAPCHGILMAIYSAVPEAEYVSTGIERQNTYHSRVDYFQPEFDKLGMQPTFFYESYFTPDAERNSNIVGWNYRYIESKLKYDVIHSGFVKDIPGWTTNRTNDAQSNELKSFLIDPSYLDKIMLVNFIQPDTVRNPEYNEEDAATVPGYDVPEYINNTSMTPFATDPLIHSLEMKCFKTSVMSTYGLPNL